MVIDTSALVAILRTESERCRFLEAMEAADSRRMSVAIFVETSIVIDARYGAEGLRDLDRLMAGAILRSSRWTGNKDRQLGMRSAGSGRDGIAALNYGDCFSYALPYTLGEPLLCKGNDFIHTDIVVADAGSAS